MRLGTLLLCVSACVAAACASGEEYEDPTVVSKSGKFLGWWMKSRRGRRFEAYRGIKYAEPPVGKLRFQPPRAILRYRSVVDATRDGWRCPQPMLSSLHIDEDCLMLNVYTPRTNSSKPFPVVVYIHAGMFYMETSRSNELGPEYLLDRDLVLVTLNYRLGSLGFLALGTKEAPGNNGFKDQVAALKWVKRNIRAFGGDPGRVTLAGCGAGSASVMLHMISPMSKGLFHGAISLSGAPPSKVGAPRHRLDLAEKQALVANCTTSSPGAIYRCLRNKTQQEIVGNMRSFAEFGYDPISLWQAVVEPKFGQERFLSEEPMAAIRAGRMHAVPYVLGQTRDDFFWMALPVIKNSTHLSTMNKEWDRIAPISFILPRDNSSAAVRRLKEEYFKDLAAQTLKNDAASAEALGRLYGDAITAFSVHRLANLMCRHSKKPVWYFEFDYSDKKSHSQDSTTKKFVGLGLLHHDVLIYLFALKYLVLPIDVADTDDSRMVDKMTAIWYNFARYRNPNPQPDTPEVKTLSWPVMTPADRNYLRLGKTFSVQSRLFEERFKVWDEIYPIKY